MKITKAIFLHLLPGFITIILIILSAPLMQKYHFHTGLSFLFAFLFITIPLYLYLLLREGKKINGFLSFKNVNLYSISMPVWQYVVFFLSFVVLAFGLLFLLSPVNTYLAENIFYWLPSCLRDNGLNQQLSYRAMLFFFILQIIVDGILIPIAEEF